MEWKKDQHLLELKLKKKKDLSVDVSTSNNFLIKSQDCDLHISAEKTKYKLRNPNRVIWPPYYKLMTKKLIKTSIVAKKPLNINSMYSIDNEANGTEQTRYTSSSCNLDGSTFNFNSEKMKNLSFKNHFLKSNYVTHI